MRVRVYDKRLNQYFKSEVYAIINRGWFSQYLVLVPCDNGDYLRLYDYIDKSRSGPVYPVNINLITPDVFGEWINKAGAFLLKVKKILKENKSDAKFDSFYGYPWILENSRLLADLIVGNSIVYNDIGFKKISSAIEGWNYIETQEDANKLLSLFSGFHDSVLKGLNYISGSKILDNGGMLISDDIRQVAVIFESEFSQSIEMAFEGVEALNLRPAKDNYTSNIYNAAIIVKDETIYFCDQYMEAEDLTYEGTWIKSFGLRWRFIS